ncbi:MAG: META domain-containing protein [Pseudomonadota bacterium]
MRVLALFLGMAACAGDETISAFSPAGTVWHLSELDGAAFAARATVTFPAEGEVAGEGPCNRFTAAQAVPYPWIEIGPIAATRRACPDLAAEGAFFAALSAVSVAEVSGPVLILSGERHEMVFRAASSTGE